MTAALSIVFYVVVYGALAYVTLRELRGYYVRTAHDRAVFRLYASNRWQCWRARSSTTRATVRRPFDPSPRPRRSAA